MLRDMGGASNHDVSCPPHLHCSLPFFSYLTRLLLCFCLCNLTEQRISKFNTTSENCGSDKKVFACLGHFRWEIEQRFNLLLSLGLIELLPYLQGFFPALLIG